jgi:GDP-4-dehydro-6-deoxy-D-mannose reductase
VHNLDILDIAQISELLNRLKPDYIFHLAAQSSVAYSWKNPGLTIDVNIKGCANLLDAVKDLDYKPRVLLIGSGEEYGHIRDGECPIVEDNVLRPGNIYAATKSCQNMLGRIYAGGYGLDIMMVRAFNHIGPNQTPTFVVADFCKQVADIEKGLAEPIIYVGNLGAKRDFTDVRDVVRAYGLLVQGGVSGETYNVGTGHAIAIQEILDMIVGMSSAKISVRVDENKLRPVDVPIIEPDITKIKNTVGWTPRIKLETTLQETLNYWRNV